MIKLLNSAMMPSEGHYSLREVDKRRFCEVLQDAHASGSLESYIGYQANIELIAKWTGIELPFNREVCALDEGDSLLIMKLRYRIGDPAMKGGQVDEDDFEFFFCNFVPIRR